MSLVLEILSCDAVSLFCVGRWCSVSGAEQGRVDRRRAGASGLG